MNAGVGWLGLAHDTMEHANQLLGALAALGWLYGVLSDYLGESRRIQANSVVGLVLHYVSGIVSTRWHLKIMGRRRQEERRPESTPKPADLIQLGYRMRSSLMRDPSIVRVEVGLMGNHLILTAYKSMISVGNAMN
jgi:hypothetical protein